MNYFTSIVFTATLTVTGVLSAAEFSKEKIHHYASYVRATPEIKQYINCMDQTFT